MRREPRSGGTAQPRGRAKRGRGTSYRKDPGSRVWARPGFRGIGYSDSATREEALLEALRRATDLGTQSLELSAHITDWVSEAHLSPSRSNLLRPLDFSGVRTVLELGAGCGALTRYLGELGLEVDAVEGSRARAECAAERCRDLDKVRVFAEEITAFVPDRLYDVVTLVGVLEYARVYIDAADPVDACLRLARGMLKKDGVLVLAIENQVGLKYFNGCAEDHLGTAFSGLTDLYMAGTAVTFGKVELEGRIRESGFGRVDWSYPFPDYKLPTSVISQRGLADPELRVGEMLLGDFARDYTGNVLRSFDESSAWAVLERNALAGDLANSFLVVASAGQGCSLDDGRWLAHRYAPQRLPMFAVDTAFLRDPDRGLVVAKTRLDPEAPVAQDVGEGGLRVEHRLGTHPYVTGRILARDFFDAVARGYSPADLGARLRPWIDYLASHARAGKGEALHALQIPGELLDCIPTNIVVDDSGAMHPIDLEFAVPGEIPLSWVALRGTVHLASRGFGHRILAKMPFLRFLKEVLPAMGLGELDWQRCLELEDGLIRTVLRPWHGRPESAILRGRVDLPICSVRSVHEAHEQMRARVTELEEVNGQASERARRLADDFNQWLNSLPGLETQTGDPQAVQSASPDELPERISGALAWGSADREQAANLAGRLRQFAARMGNSSAMARDNRSLAADLNESSSRIAALLAELADRGNALREARQEASRLEVERERLASRGARIEAEAAELGRELERLSGRLEESGRDALELKHELERSSDRRIALERELATLRAEAGHAREAAQEERRLALGLQADVEAARIRQEEMESELARERGRVDALRDERNALRTEASSLAADAATLKRGLERQRADVVRLQGVAQSATHRVSDLEYEMSRMSASATWKLAAPLRLFHRWVPQPWNFTRSAAKLAWWLVSFQLGARLELRKRAEALSRSGLFDPAHYLHRNPDVRNSGEDPIKHFLRTGWSEGRNPCSLFHESWYRQRNPQGLLPGESGVEHYARRGESQGLWPNPLFDPQWYLDMNPDVREMRSGPLAHYLGHGAREGKDPHPLFDTDWYLGRYPDAAALAHSWNPLAHFLDSAGVTGHSPCELFDTEWYLGHHADVAASGTNPLVHYLETGAAEGRDPSGSFRTSWYLANNPDVAASGSNPLVHFRLAGSWEGRSPMPPAALGAAGAGETSAAMPPPQPEFRADGVAEWAEYGPLKARIAELTEGARRQVAAQPRDMVRIADADVEEAIARLDLPAAGAPLVSIVIPVFNKIALTLECLHSIARSGAGVSFEVIVADDGSEDGSSARLAAVANLVIHSNEANLGFLRNCNSAFPLVRGEYTVLLNNDVQVEKGWLDALLRTFSEHAKVGAAVPKIVFPSGELQEAGVALRADGSVEMVGLLDDPGKERYGYARPVDYGSGACLMVRTDLLRSLGGFSEEFAPCYCEDSDLCLRIRREGFRILYQPAATVIHHLSKTTAEGDGAVKLRSVSESLNRFVGKWQEELDRLSAVRLLAFYLPQFHPIPENDHWWGAGFTEWSNVARARPNFIGHYQPRIPADLGFYDLRIPEVMDAQASLALRYGIGGFCYYYYWFAGRRLLHAPLERMLETGRPDMPFCLCWANENWTRRWDGEDNEILIAQDHSPADDEAVIRDIIRYFRSGNYIRVDGKPLLLVYRVTLFPDFRATAERWRRICRDEGVGDIYLAMVESFDLVHANRHPATFNCDASVEFPPLGMAQVKPPSGTVLNAEFAGQVGDYRDIAARFCARPLPGFTRFRGVMPGWDNTARRQNNSFCFEHSSPGAFQAWLETAIAQAWAQHQGDERIVFLNAWNEWAEGAYLEPDRRFGHGYLEAVRNALDADRLLRMNRYALDL